MKKLIPVLLVIFGLVAGVAGGLFVSGNKLEDGTETIECVPVEKPEDIAKKVLPAETEFVKLNNQFVVPVVSDGLVKSLVVLSLSVEVTEGLAAQVYAVEPRIRDSFLQVLFDFANLGGFDGSFTNSNNLINLKDQLYQAARKGVGDDVRGILIIDIVRQDV